MHPADSYSTQHATVHVANVTNVANVAGAPARIVVLAMGNLLRRDEGLAIHALQRLQVTCEVPDRVQLVDGGTLGLELLSYLEDADRLLILDATLTGGPPGTLLRAAGDDIPAFLGIRTSPHEVGLTDLLAVAHLRGVVPAEVVVLGMQPDSIELGSELSPAVEEQLPAFVDAITAELRRWDVEISPAHTSR